jgi:hypothetical protein
MTTARTNPSSAPPGKLAPLLVWLLMQLLALLLSISNAPLFARPAHAMETYALGIMLAVQVAAAVLLFPWLLRDATDILRVMVSAWLFDQLAGMLAMQEASDIVVATVGISTWLVGLSLWSGVCATMRMQLAAVALLSSASIGLVAAICVSMEFADESLPLSGALIWGVLWANLLAAGLARIFRRFFAPSYPPPSVRLSTSSEPKRP